MKRAYRTKTKKMRTAVKTAALMSLGIPLATMPAIAQDDEGELAPVVITGSNIPTVELEGPSPVVTIDREEINRSGAETVGELLRRLPQNNAGSYDEKFQNSFAPGSSGISLRGLGMGYTLVLVNGRRIASYSMAQNTTTTFTDLNGIPMAVIDRVDLLLDGASAIYGSDAVAGVVNIITREDFDGVEITAGYSNTANEDAATQTYSITGGTVGERGSAWINISYLQRNAVAHKDRKFSRSADQSIHGGLDWRSSAGNPGSIKLLGGDESPYDSGFYRVPANTITPTAGEIVGELTVTERTVVDDEGNETIVQDRNWSGAGRNYFDYGPWQSLTPEVERYSTSGRVNYQLSDWADGFVETTYQKNKTHQWMAPTPAFGDVDGYTVSADNPYNPFGEEVTFRHRLTEAGSRISDIDTDVFRVLPGVEITLPSDKWKAEAAFLFSSVDSTRLSQNMISADALQDALNSENIDTAYNVFGGGLGVNDPAIVDALKIQTLRSSKSELQQFDVKTAGDLAELPGGTLQLAAGVEARQESASDLADPFTMNSKVVGSGGTSNQGSRDLTSGYAELYIPIIGEENRITGIHSLGVQTALRVENYSDFGTTDNPKIGIKYQPIERLLLRATYQTAFKAPTLPEMYMGETVSYPFLLDSARNDQAKMQYRQIAGGNENLDPEESDNISVGAILEVPMPENFTLDLRVNWGQYELEDVITTVGSQFMLDNEELFKDKIVRNPQTDEDKRLGIPGSILQINNGYQNLAEREVEVFDIGIDIGYDSTIGYFNWSADFSNIYKWDSQAKPGDPFFERAGSFGYPEWRGKSSLWWSYDKYSLGATVNYTDSFDQYYYPRYGLTESTVDDMTTLDIQGNYQITDTSTLTLGALNATNEAPPWVDDGPEGFALGVPGHSVFGTVLYGRVAVRF